MALAESQLPSANQAFQPVVKQTLDSLNELRPVNGHVIVQEPKKDNTTNKSGIIIVADEQADEVVEKGEVLAVAEGLTTGVKVGDTIFYNKMIPMDLKIDRDGESYIVFVLNERDIMAIVNK